LEKVGWRIFQFKLSERRRILSAALAKTGARIGLDRAVSFFFDRRSTREAAEKIFAIELVKIAVAKPSQVKSAVFCLCCERRGDNRRRSVQHGCKTTYPIATPKYADGRPPPCRHVAERCGCVLSAVKRKLQFSQTLEMLYSSNFSTILNYKI